MRYLKPTSISDKTVHVFLWKLKNMYLSDQFVHIYLLFSKSQKISSDGFSKGQVNMNVVVSIEVLNTKSIVFQLLNGNIWCCASDDCLIVRWNPCE